LTTGNILKNYLLTAFTTVFRSKKFIFDMSVNKTDALIFINKLLLEDKIKPVIDKVYPFDQLIEAHRYVDLKHKKGNVVVTL